jgi:uncharacterized protein
LAHSYSRTLAGVPCLIAEPSPALPWDAVVIWCHGFRADALAHAAELEMCADAGFLAVGIDAVGHGARSDPELPAWLAGSPDGAMPVMLDLVEQTMHELPALIRALQEQYGIQRSRVSMVGISMGAFLAYRSVAAGLPLRAVVALLGTPKWLGETSAHLSLAAFRNVALLSITAEYDVSVPPDDVAPFHEQLAQATPSGQMRHDHHFILRDSGHLTNADAWQRAMRVTLQWLQRMG